jgi:hypothetical protein
VQGAEADRAIPLDYVRDNPYNPRKMFEQTEIHALAESISKVGLLNLVRVRQDESGFVLVHGHRRVRAARLLKWKDIPATVVTCSDEEPLLASVIENLERRDLSDYERASLSGRCMRNLARQRKISESWGAFQACGLQLHRNDPSLRRRAAESGPGPADGDSFDLRASFALSVPDWRPDSAGEDAPPVVDESLSIRDLQRMSFHLRSWFPPGPGARTRIRKRHNKLGKRTLRRSS